MHKKEALFLKQYTDLCNKHHVHIVNGGKYGLGLQSFNGKVYKIMNPPETPADDVGIIPIITVMEG